MPGVGEPGAKGRPLQTYALASDINFGLRGV